MFEIDMKALLEEIKYDDTTVSFHVFNRSEKSFFPYWHFHPEAELTLIKKGEGTRVVGDSIMNYGESDLVLLGKNLPHHWISAKSSRLNDAVVVQFNEKIFNTLPEFQCFEKLMSRANSGIYFPNPSSQLTELIESLTELRQLERLMAFIRVFEILKEHENAKELASSEYIVNRPKVNSHEKIAQTKEYILKNIQRNLTVNELANFTHMVPQSFCRWFKYNTGHTFISYIQKTRIELVSSQLISSEESIQNIAYSYGFQSLSHFNNLFKRIKGLPPGKFRETFKSKNS